MAKKLITFLGTTGYKSTIYYFQDEDKEEKNYEKDSTRFVQVPLCKRLGQGTEVIVFCTKEAEENNYLTDDAADGLYDVLNNNGFKAEKRIIKSGKDENELWENFCTIFSEFNKNDEIYVDVTYSLRSIPIIFMSLLSYSRVVNNINVKNIYYGAYDIGENIEDEHGKYKKVLIFDLSFFNVIQEWSGSIESFLKTGNAIDLYNVIDSSKAQIISENNKQQLALVTSISKLLRNYSKDLLTCRGKSILKDGKKLKESLISLKNSSPLNINQFMPLANIINRIYEKVGNFNGNPVNDSIEAVKSCRDFGLIQQAFTLFNDTLITYCAVKKNLDYKSKEEREKARKIITSHRIGNELQSVKELYDKVKSYRNDLDHSGFWSEPKDYRKFKNALDYLLNEFDNIVKKKDKCDNPITENQNLKRNAAVILSHKLLNNQVEELKLKWNVESIIYMPADIQQKWSNINPEIEFYDEDGLTSQIKKFISENTNENDLVIVQGEWGMTFTVVNMCFNLNRIPIYATTKRINKETINDGQVTVKKIFSHVRFRQYIL